VSHHCGALCDCQGAADVPADGRHRARSCCTCAAPVCQFHSTRANLCAAVACSQAMSAPHVTSALTGSPYYHGLLSFSLEQVGEYDRAEVEGRRGADLVFDDVWSQHAVAHALYGKVCTSCVTTAQRSSTAVAVSPVSLRVSSVAVSDRAQRRVFAMRWCTGSAGRQHPVASVVRVTVAHVLRLHDYSQPLPHRPQPRGLVYVCAAPERADVTVCDADVAPRARTRRCVRRGAGTPRHERVGGGEAQPAGSDGLARPSAAAARVPSSAHACV
jgi:hypothetical protein